MIHYSSAQESLSYLAKFVPNSILVNNATPVTTTFTYSLSQDKLAISIVATVAASSSVAVSIYPIDPAGNVLNSAALLTAATLSATGNIYESGEIYGFRKVQVAVTVTGTVTGCTLVIYG